MCWGRGYMEKSLYLPLKFFCEVKTAQNIKSIKNYQLKKMMPKIPHLPYSNQKKWLASLGTRETKARCP